MKEKILLGVIAAMFMISFCFAATDTVNIDDNFRINNTIHYAKPCYNNQTYCSASAVCNYTFYRPDGSTQVANVLAENRGYDHNYNISFDTGGLYKIYMVCNDGGVSGTQTYYAQVTSSGFNNTLGFFIIIIAIAAGLIILGFTAPDGWFVVMGGMILISLGIYSIINGIAEMRDTMLTWGVSLFLIGAGAYLSIKSAIEMMGDD